MGAGTLEGDLGSVTIGVCGLRIGRRVVAGGETITCISRSCSSACCTGE